MTQIQQPGAMDEPDLKKRLSMFSVHVEVRGRITILKTLSFAKGAIVSHVEAQAREGNGLSFKGGEEYLQKAINKRLEHYLNPQLAQ